jgi:hypothetical protein
MYCNTGNTEFAMKRILYDIIRYSLAITALTLLLATVGSAEDDVRPLAVDRLLTAGKVGPKAIGLNVRIERPDNESASGQHWPVLKVLTSENAYVTAIYISPKGEATVLVPSKEAPDNLFAGGKDYSLFGPDSKVKLVAEYKQKGGKIVFFASSNLIKLDPLFIHEGQDFISIDSSAVKDMEILCDQISSMSTDERFNRKVVDLKDESGEDALELMGLPTNVKSDKPESVTGIQGLKDNKLDSQKE